MKALITGIVVATLGSGAAYAQPAQGNAARPAAPPATAPTSRPVAAPTATTPGAPSGPAAATGNGNQAVATTSANAPSPAKGANSFTQGQAQTRLKDNGFGDVGPLTKDQDGIWRGKATKAGQQVSVWVDYKGNVGQQ